MLETVNVRLEHQPYITSTADHGFFGDLLSEIQSLLQPGENIALPDVLEAGAWSKAWRIYTELKHRPGLKQVAPKVDYAAHWRETAREVARGRDYVKTVIHRVGLSEERGLELLGLSRKTFQKRCPIPSTK